MAKRRPEKKRDENKPAEQRILPMQFRVGDRLADETREYELIGPTWSAHERVEAKRGGGVQR